MTTLPFTFGIPLLPRSAARNWRRVEALLELTLASVFAQTDQDFTVVVAGHDRPESLPDDPRICFLEARWPAVAVRADNGDRGRKADALNRYTLEHGGGLLMLLDADDWVDVRLVEMARAALRGEEVAAVVETGFAVDFRGLRAAPLPHDDVFPGEFHRLCGSSVVLKLRPHDAAPLRRDPYQVLHEHYRVIEEAALHGGTVARMPAAGAYVINTEENHSEIHGPYAAWRRDFCAAVDRVGAPADAPFAARFGFDIERLQTAAAREYSAHRG